ncbi:Zn-dependent hydrolase [Alteribacillus sp. HJP-4]|uniref:Zn-dependent hydrolase n=1 Tax=Alteribacillus sp. HJP-4 TaxID=2775394 RepID=UPI0035CD01C4
MKINRKRVEQRFHQLNQIGMAPDGGITRLSLSNEDKQARDLFVEWLTELGLQITIDDLGNIYGTKPGEDNNRKPIVFGSHFDSVPDGGMFDGVLGVLAGLEIIETIIEKNISHRQPLIVANFTNEEGARFPIPMIASGVLGGVYSKEKMYNLTDNDGKSIKEELERIEYLGQGKNRLKEIEAFMELHIEQGPVLEQNQKHIGIVKGIQGLSWLRVHIIGEADHAGPTPMPSRKDAAITSMRIMLDIHEWVESLNDSTIVTFGQIIASPNVVNVIPGKVSFTIDIRHPDAAALADRKKECLKRIAFHTNDADCSWEHEELSEMPPVPFHEPFILDLKDICLKYDYSFQILPSGAGHDAMHITRLGPTVMIFVPSVEGKSHNKKELTHWEHIDTAINLMYEWTEQFVHGR